MKTQKTIISVSNKKTLKLKILAKKKEDVRRKLAVTAKQLSLKAKQLFVIAKEKENIRRKLEITAKKLAVTAKDKESTRLKLKVFARALQASRKTLENKVVERTKDLQKARANDEAILASIGDGLVVVDINGKIRYVNKSFEEMLGWKKQEIIGKSMVKVVPREYVSGAAVSFKKSILTQVLSGKNFIADLTNPFYFVRKDKSRFPVSLIVAPVVINGKIVGAVESFRDITKEKAIDKAKTEFISLASHQLRTPLTAISWYAEMISSGDVGTITQDQKKYLEEIYEGNKRMIELVNTLLDVSRLELGTFNFQPKSVLLKDVVNDVLKELEPEILIQNLTIDKNYDSLLPTIYADPKTIRMIFQNLFSNAVKYVGVNGKIVLDISVQKPNILIKVWNNGVEIPKESLPKIFTKFFREEIAVQKDPSGNGLGLYIVKTIVENFGGKIWLESDKNKGTAFYVSLPLENIIKKKDAS